MRPILSAYFVVNSIPLEKPENNLKCTEAAVRGNYKAENSVKCPKTN